MGDPSDMERKGGRMEMNLLGSIAIAFSMYSRIPMPKTQWTEKRMEYAMCFFPLVGAVEGVLYGFFGWICTKVGFSSITIACFGTLLPIIVTGGIHMDGFADTIDALSSYQPAEKKLEILKDPHIGAFGVIGIVSYLLAYAGLFSQLCQNGMEQELLIYAAVPVMSRAFSGLSVVSFPKAKKDGLAASFSDGSKKIAVQASMGVYIVMAFLWFFCTAGLLPAFLFLGTGLCGFGYYYHMCRKQFGGMTGDLAGYFLQIEELILLFTAAAAGKAGIL